MIGWTPSAPTQPLASLGFTLELSRRVSEAKGKEVRRVPRFLYRRLVNCGVPERELSRNTCRNARREHPAHLQCSAIPDNLATSRNKNARTRPENSDRRVPAFVRLGTHGPKSRILAARGQEWADAQKPPDRMHCGPA